MPLPFHRTLRALDGDHFGLQPLGLLIALALLGAWTAWMVEARVPIYAVSNLGRIEVSATSHRSAASSTGRVVQVAAELGQLVQEGQVLVRLDDALERRRVDEADAALAAVELRIAALESQRGVEERVRQSQSKASEAALEKSRVELAEVGQRSAYRKQQASISEQLRREALISETQALDAAEQLSNSQWQISAAQAGIEKERADSAYADQVHVAQIANLRRQLADLEASRLTARAALETAHTALERMLIRAPVAGRIGSLAQLQIGDLAREGDVVATVIPDDRLQVTAEFSPAEALGRVKPGQAAQIRLLGFSSAEFGSLPAEVSRVAGEPHAGAIRVELLLPRATDPRLPLQHGLPGSVEVCVERVAPWRLLLRSLDRFVALPAPDGLGEAGPPKLSLHSPLQGSTT